MAGEDPGYVDAAHRLPCFALALAGHRCDGPIEAHHAGSRLGAPVKGGDRRAHDHTVVPLCKLAHQALHASAPPFRDMGKAGKREWQDRKIEATWLVLHRYATIPRMSQPGDQS